MNVGETAAAVVFFFPSTEEQSEPSEAFHGGADLLVFPPFGICRVVFSPQQLALATRRSFLVLLLAQAAIEASPQEVQPQSSGEGKMDDVHSTCNKSP